MNREIRDLQARLDALLDQWIRATPAERAKLVLEKIKLEESLDAAKKRELARTAS